MTALRRANAIRLARAELKRDIADGVRSVSSIFCEPTAANMPLMDALCAQRRWGTGRALKLLRSQGIGEHRTIGSLTERQRRALIDVGV